MPITDPWIIFMVKSSFFIFIQIQCGRGGRSKETDETRFKYPDLQLFFLQ